MISMGIGSLKAPQDKRRVKWLGVVVEFQHILLKICAGKLGKHETSWGSGVKMKKKGWNRQPNDKALIKNSGDTIPCSET